MSQSDIEVKMAKNRSLDILHSLLRRIKQDHVEFTTGDVNDLYTIIETLRQLEQKCIASKTAYETESINVSALRHKLSILPSQTENDILIATNNARAENQQEIDTLQLELRDLDNEIKEKEAETERLEKENSILIPERDRLRDSYEQTILRLNQHMSEKAAKQIHLNKTREEVKRANSTIVTLEEDMVLLKEALIQERSDARVKRRSIMEDIKQTVERLKKQQSINDVKEKDLNEKLFDQRESQKIVDDLKEKICALDMKKISMEQEETRLHKKLDERKIGNRELVSEAASLREHISNANEEFEEITKKQTKQIAEIEEDLEKEQRKEKILCQHKIDLEHETRIAAEREQESKQATDIIEEKVKAVKQTVADKAEEIGALRQDNESMTDQLAELLETHKTIVTQLQNEIDEIKGGLVNERQERIELQNKRGETERELEDFKAQNTRYFSQVTKRIRENKDRHGRLTNEAAFLQGTIKEEDRDIKNLKEELLDKKKSFAEMKQTKEHQIEKIEKEMSDTREIIREKTMSVEQMMSPFEDLKNKYEEMVADYDNMKKTLIQRRNKHTSLKEQINRMTKDISKLEKPRAKLKKDLETIKEDLKVQKATASNETEMLEKKIYSVLCKMRIIESENHMLMDGVEALQADINFIQNQVNSSSDVDEFLRSVVRHLRKSLDEAWERDRLYQEQIKKRDLILMKQMKDVRDFTTLRYTTLDGVAGHMREHLSSLGNFLEVIGGNRPIDTPAV